MSSWLAVDAEQFAADGGERFVMAHAQLSVGSLEVLRGRRLHHHFAPHMHEVPAIGSIDAGASRVWYRGETSSSSRGALIALSAGEMHTGAPASEEGWSYRMLYPSASLLAAALEGDACEESLLFREPFIADADARAKFDAAFAALVRNGCELSTEELVLEFLRTLVRRHAARAPVDTRAIRHRGSAVVAHAKEFLDDHFAKPVCLSAVATECGVSPFHLIRLFRREFGVPPRAYLKQLRVSRARDMLRAGAELSHVAYACGFSDQSHLTRAFKSMIGVPPGAYRRAVLA